MKKLMIFGIAALTLCAGFTSCSHDEDFGGMSAKAKQAYDTYEEAFITRFGPVSPDQTWGFYDMANAARTRNIDPVYQFPQDADASKFLSDVPSGITELTQNAASVNNYINANTVSRLSELNIWGAWDGQKNTGGVLYITGNCDFSNKKFYIAPNTDVFILNGATLTIRAEDSGNLQGGCNYYIANGAKLVTTGELLLNNGMRMYNHGTIETPKLSVNNSSILYNSNTATINGELSVENSNSVIVNDGDITATRLHTAGSGHVQNNHNMTITGNTDIDSNSNTWVNNDTYVTENFYYTAGSCDVINNCRLTVNNLFKINLGDTPNNGFRMDSNCGVEAGSFLMSGPAFIFMGSNSVFKVSGTATMDATKADYGIYGPTTGDFAVFQAKDIVKGTENQGYEVTYGNKLAVVCQTHFDQGYSGSYPYIDFKGEANENLIYKNGAKPAITIPETPCNPGFSGNGGGGGGGTRTDEMDILVIAEDLTVSERGDFDFNDVIFGVKWKAGGTGATITLLAAGGTLPLYVAGEEVHQKFEVATSQMVNTGSSGIIRDPVSFDITGNYSTMNANDILVQVKKSGELIELQAIRGKVPSKIAVSTSFNWCDERQDIENKYNDFPKWCRGEVDSFY